MDLRKSRRVLLTTILVTTFLLSTIGTNVTAYPLSMPEENINYNVISVDGVLWAKIDGTYPITYSGSETSILMVYPTPPGTTNISIRLDDIELEWSNFTQISEEMHHTAIGDWQMISTVLERVSEFFVLKIHYEHPIQVINGSYAFLYDLNIEEYLSGNSSKSVAHFTIRMETGYTNLKVNTIFGEDETLKPIEFTSSGDAPVEIKIDEVSEFGKPLPGDLLVSFSEPKVQEPFSTLWVIISIFVIGFIVATLIGYGLFRRHSNREDKSTQL